jgi:hypothetical protein
LSNAGDQIEIPITFGITNMIAPLIADMAGKPI